LHSFVFCCGAFALSSSLQPVLWPDLPLAFFSDLFASFFNVILPDGFSPMIVALVRPRAISRTDRWHFSGEWRRIGVAFSAFPRGSRAARRN
jgi:hypothetical protein